MLKKIKNIHNTAMKALRSYSDKEFYDHSYDYMLRFYKYSCKKFKEWKENGLLQYRACPICSSKNGYVILDKRNIDCCKYTKCLDCEFVYINPFPQEKYYNEIYISGYDGLDAWWNMQEEEHGVINARLNESQPALNWLRKRKKNGLLLDYGCGAGVFLSKARNFYDVYGVDLNDNRIRMAKELLGAGSEKKVMDLKQIDESLFYGKFDIVHSEQNLEHLLDPLIYLKKFYKWLKPGGILYLSCPCSDSFAFSMLRENNSMATLSHVSLFSKNSLTHALRSVGFENIEFFYTRMLDVTALEFWRKVFRQNNFIHRHAFIENDLLVTVLYPTMLLTTIWLYVFSVTGILKGNYFYSFAKKPV